MGWNQIRWTEARQIASSMDVEEADLPAEGVEPEAHYAALREAGDKTNAVLFLAAALSRLEAVAWAGHVIEQAALTAQLKPADRQALDHALRWLGDQSDPWRRAARTAGESAGERSPERMLAMAVFFSGGSISDPDLPAVPPGPGVAGRFAAGAILMAAMRDVTKRDEVLDAALALGERIADEGTRALAA